jgi:hypothetical protein
MALDGYDHMEAEHNGSSAQVKQDWQSEQFGSLRTLKILRGSSCLAFALINTEIQ